MLTGWVAVFVSFSSGIILAYHGCWYGLLMVLGLLLLYYWRFPGLETVIVIIVLLLGAAYFQLREGEETGVADIVGERVVKGCIIDYPVQSGGTSRFKIKTQEKTYRLRYIQVYADFEAQLQRGQQISLQGQLELPDRAGNPGEFDYAGYLKTQRIYYLMSIERPQDIKLISPDQGIQRQLNLFRERIENVFYDILPSVQADLLLGMLLGAKENIETGQYEMYQKTGIVHIFSVSGLHVGFLVLFFYYLTSLLAWSPGTRFIFISACLLAYGSLIAWPISVQRSVIMAIMALLAQYQGRQGAWGNSLGLAGILIVLLDPYALFTVSFQLSFLATWGLVCLYPSLKEYLRYQQRIWDLVLIPFCAQLAVVPVIAYYFNLFTPIGILYNTIISYLAGGIVLCGFAALVLVFLPSLAALFLYPAGLMLEIMNAMTLWLQQLPGSYLWVKTPESFSIAIYYGALLLLMLAWQHAWSGRWSLGIGVLLLGALLSILWPASFCKYGVLEIVFLDVGQGDSILIKTPRGKFILLDGGGSHFYPVGQKKVLPYLHYRGIREIYMIINSHPDSDHLLGLLETVQEIPFRYAVLPSTLMEAEEYRPLREIAARQRAVVLGAVAGQKINIDTGLELEVLYPPSDLRSSDYNQHSLVLRCEYGRFSMLLPGDLGIEGLEHIAELAAIKNTLVFKVPHHGSRSSLSPDLYAKAKPYIAVISLGKNNSYGHPNREVLDYLEANEILLLRTDQNGAITMESDGQHLAIQCFKPSKAISSK
ncbi:MAG: DNA internalization-related competence protein ComEC/Rec2 [Syntrophomonadaceae bacterium]|jgi:competence protein ComEC|nr:DNA internalization-related competence protein ComEC/Rec2 [Syntrophomonadaceae bacterium]